MASDSNDVNNDKFDLDIDELLNQLAELTNSPLNSHLNSHQACLFLLLLWDYFEVSILETNKDGTGKDRSGAKTLAVPNIIQIEQGYQIFDYGALLKTSSGKFYGSYTTGRLLTTVSAIIELLVQRGAKRVKIDGLAAAKRFAWIKCENYAIEVINFQPDTKEKTLQSQLQRLNSL